MTILHTLSAYWFQYLLTGDVNPRSGLSPHVLYRLGVVMTDGLLSFCFCLDLFSRWPLVM